MRTKAGFFFFATLFSLAAMGQQSSQLGYFDFLPQSVVANPAIKPKGKLNIGIPALSSIGVSHRNNWFKPGDFLVSDGNGTARIEPEQILSQIDESAYTGAGLDLELLHVGFQMGGGKHYVHFRAAERMQFALDLPKDIFYLAAYGNVGQHSFENNTANFSGLSVDAIHFREYALGYRYEINEKIAVGATAKYLYGMERVFTDQSSLQLRTDPNTYDLQSSGTLRLQTAGIQGLVSDEGEEIHGDVANYLLGLKNTGFAGDLGVVVKPIEKLQVQVSVNDLGFIKWQSDAATYEGGDASFAYRGIDLTDFIFETGSDFDDALEDHLDSLVNELEDTYDFEATPGAFKTSVNGFMRYGASYEIFGGAKARGSAWANVIHGVGRSAIPFTYSIGYNQTFKHWLQAGVHYSNSSFSTGALGAGLSVNAGPFQIYCLAENFKLANLTKVNLIDDDGSTTSLVYPSNSDDIRVSFGLNLTFGMKDEPSGRPMTR
ncbi:MAG TPA: DUF5723 family protein [Cryomorphaceae bacterium]|nr:DUF5723 family protein [Cryomorphaceae bacterium]